MDRHSFLRVMLCLFAPSFGPPASKWPPMPRSFHVYVLSYVACLVLVTSPLISGPFSPPALLSQPIPRLQQCPFSLVILSLFSTIRSFHVFISCLPCNKHPLLSCRRFFTCFCLTKNRVRIYANCVYRLQLPAISSARVSVLYRIPITCPLVYQVPAII